MRNIGPPFSPPRCIFAPTPPGRGKAQVQDPQSLVVQMATKLSAVLEKDFMPENRTLRRNIFKRFCKNINGLFNFNVFTPWRLFKVDFTGKVTSLKLPCYMFNIHAPFKFCGYFGLQIVHFVLCRKKLINFLREETALFK